MFNGVLALKNSEKRCFPSFLKVRKKDDSDKKVFPRFLNREEKNIFDGEKYGFSTMVLQ